MFPLPLSGKAVILGSLIRIRLLPRHKEGRQMSNVKSRVTDAARLSPSAAVATLNFPTDQAFARRRFGY